MAILTATELTTIRNYCERHQVAAGYLKAQINAAIQAIEDAMTTQTVTGGMVGMTIPQLISAAIDNASAFSFTGPQKVKLFALWAELKFNRDK